MAAMLLPAIPPLGTLPDTQGQPNDTTRALAAVCLAHARAEAEATPKRAHRFAVLAARLERCAQRDGWRCGSPLCPRCQRRLAVQYRRRLEARLRTPGATFALLTATVAGDDLGECEKVLLRSLGALRRRAAWRRAFAGGEQHVQAAPCQGGAARRWNVHAHAILERKMGAALPTSTLTAAWTGLVSASGLPGRIDLRPIGKHWEVRRG